MKHLKKEVEMFERLNKADMYGIPKLLLTCESSEGIEYVVEDIKGEKICDDDYGIDEDCLNLVKLRKMLKSQAKNSGVIEKNLWMIMERITSLFNDLYNQNVWLEDIRLEGSTLLLFVCGSFKRQRFMCLNFDEYQLAWIF
jgi:hypothetical protein